ncbi:FAD/NAD(P)-binding domain-containing protein [Mycena capillaripes]|nr:FAD/NAD(P)-binding domain-containing protein [Mycena capillaripes]
MSTSDFSNPLNVSVVGAGIAGLTAAIALRRNGHLVQIFEASEIKTEIGAALGVPPNAYRVLDHLGVCRENLKGVSFSGNVVFDDKSGEGTEESWSTPSANKNPGLFVHRSDLYEELKRLATGDGEGPPAKLRLGSKVLECDPEEGTVTLSSGEVVHADLILGADGINSVIRTHVLGGVQKASPSGWSCFRAVFEPTAALGDIPELQWFTSGVSGTRTVVAKDGQFRMFLFYPCRSGALVNFVGFFPDSQDAARDWTPTASREDIVAQFQDFHPKFLRIFDLPTHSEILKWKLRVLPLLPTWIHGRAGLLGDAAHGTLPLLGMGAAMAIEEGGSIGCLFPAGTRREDIPARLEAYQDLRKQRGDFVKTESVEQVSRLMHGGPAEFLMGHKMQSYLMEYDAIGAAQQCYDERFGAKSPST